MIKAFFDQYQSDRKTEEPHNKSDRTIAKRTFYAVTIYTIITGCLLIFTAMQYRETHDFDEKQIGVINDQIKIMRADQRPWVYGDILPNKGVILDTNGITLGFSVDLINVGHAPAERARAVIQAFVPSGNFDYLAAVDFVCRIADSETASGAPIFPGKDVPQAETVSITKEDLSKSLIAQHGMLHPYVISCIAYYIYGEKGVHFTANAYDLLMKHPRPGQNCCVISLSNTDIKAEELSLVPSAAFPGIAN